IHCEGVADGMIAVSALVTGLPGGVVQKNRDAALLSPAALLDGSLGNRVHIRRTNRQTGAVIERDAVIRTGAGGAVVFQTREGLEALRCSGLPEGIIYDQIPSGLTDTPILSVSTTSAAATTATVTLTYLATGFDWTANYVAYLDDDSDRADLFGWMTVANNNRASFADAHLLAIAGTLNIEEDYQELVTTPPTPELHLQCYPLDGTSTTPFDGVSAPPLPEGPRLVNSCDDDECGYEDIVVTGSAIRRSSFDVPLAVTAVQELLGNLHLFRVPFASTVAANAQKQVAFLSENDVRFTRIYTAEAQDDTDEDDVQPLAIELRFTNRERDGLGTPLPSGSIAVFGAQGNVSGLIGIDALRDLAVGEEFEIAMTPSSMVHLTVTEPDDDHWNPDKQERTLTIHNTNPFAINAEIALPEYDEEDWLIERRQRGHVAVKDGNRTWTVRVPANGTARLRIFDPDE
ncbi:MAG: hypothetical protein ABL874_12870, partial [Sphingopyxis sp.]